MSDARFTPLHERHEALGASFTDFGGWMMPVRYSSDLAEHHAVREAAGLFDISHMAEFLVLGADAVPFLDGALAGAFGSMRVGKAKYSLMLNEHGGIVDDLIVYRMADDRFLIISNAGNHDAVADGLRARAAGLEVSIDDLTEQTALIAVQGPNARAILAALPDFVVTGVPLEDLGYYAWSEGDYKQTPVFIARTGYTGEDGFELLVPGTDAAALWDALLEHGAALGLVPAGLAARDTLRLEAGMPLYGHELSMETLPEQTGLGKVVATAKEHFVGKEAIATADLSDAPVLVGLTAAGRRAARAGYPVFRDDEQVGEVTSGALSPTLGHPIAMAYVAPSAAAEGTELFLDVRGTRIPATVTPRPFYRRTT